MTRNTSEQQAVIDSRVKVLAIDAFAGTGKTSTLVQYAAARPKERMLYVAFNKSVADQARERFPSHVDCRTTHSLAYAAVGHKFKHKLGNAPAFIVSQALKCTTRRAKQALSTVAIYLCSVEADIGLAHIDREQVENEADIPAVLELAGRIWAAMQDPKSDLKMPHDGYLKIWAMQKPKLPYQCLLLDEAQDTNELTLDILLDQPNARLVLVGDRHQGIYGFRKAINAMETVKAEERIALTQSFRFGQAIADVATKLLQTFKEEPLAVKGRSDIDVRWNLDYRRHHALIGRTNAGLFGAVARAVLENKLRIHFVGGFDSYLFGKVLDAYRLWAGDRGDIKDPSISRFETWADFAKYGDDAGDAEVKALVKTVDNYTTQIPKIYDAIRAAETPLERQADVTLTTAHRSKGLEWDQVHLCDDFIELPPKDDFDEEEVNLLYVALTRAIRAVKLPSNLKFWLQDQGYDFGAMPEPEVVVADPVDLPVEELRFQRDSLAKAITEASRRMGLTDGLGELSGPQLLDLCEEMAARYVKLRREANALETLVGSLTASAKLTADVNT